ncbi:MAG: hypothetical protein ACE5DT_01985 [Nitrosopumilus sp.]
MPEDKAHTYRETMQIVLLEVKLKTIKLFQKFKEGSRHSKVGN